MIKKIIQYITHDIWVKKEHEYKSRKIRWAVRQFKVVIVTAQGFGQHSILMRSAALTFYTLMSLVPIAALVFGIAKGFGLDARLNEYLFQQFPQYSTLIDQIVTFANALLQRTRGGLIASVGLVVLFWSVVKVFSNIENAFNNIWEVRRARSLARKFSDYTSVVVVTPILGILASSIALQVQRQLLNFTASWFVDILWGAASLVLVCLMFAFIYFVIPNTKVKPQNAALAGVIAGTSFQIFQWVYIFIQSHLTSYNAIYGSFAAVPLFLIWLQSSWQIVLIGAELSFSYQNIRKFEYEKQARQMSYEYHKKALLVVMRQVILHFQRREGAVSSDTMAHELNMPVRVVRDVVFDLERAGLVVATPSKEEKVNLYVPARDIHTIHVCDVLQSVEAYGKASFNDETSPEFESIAGLLDTMHQVFCKSSGNQLLMDIDVTQSATENRPCQHSTMPIQ